LTDGTQIDYLRPENTMGIRTAGVSRTTLGETWCEADESLRSRDAYLLSSENGTTGSAVAYFELEPGNHIGAHVHSCEEVVVVLEGEVQFTVDDEHVILSDGDMGVAPALVVHDARATESGKARCLGFFASATVVSVYQERLRPADSHLQGTPRPADAPPGGAAPGE
jgi:quercetin dioxygenase-like cupin family protein